MDFGFTSEQEMFRRSFAEFLSKECTSDQVREQWNDEIGYSKGVWKKMAQLGWMGLVHDEQYGGSAGDFLDLFILFEEIGKVLLPSPLFASAVLSGMLLHEFADATLKKKIMPSIITGKKILTVALMDDHGVCDHPSPAMTAVGDGGDYLINGSRLLVPYADAADEIIVCAMLTGRIGGPTLFKVDRRSQGVCCMPLETVYGEKKYAVEFVNVKVRSGDVIGTVGEGHLCMGRILPKAIVIKCAEMVGGLQHVVDATVAYAKSRIQFGHPIGSLQSVQHLCADMMSLYLGAKLTAYQAASLLNENMPCDKEVAVAKARCSDAYKTCTWMAHQIHGGIGFTEEYHLQLYFKHAKETELIFGDSRYHRSRVAAAMGL